MSKPITDHLFRNPCHCGCDGSEMLCNHYDDDMQLCLRNEKDHVFTTQEDMDDYNERKTSFYKETMIDKYD